MYHPSHPLHAINTTSEITLMPPMLTTQTQNLEEPTPTFFVWSIPRILSIGYIGFLINYLISVQGGFLQVEGQINGFNYNTGTNGTSWFGYHALGMSLWAVFFNQQAVLSFVSPI